MLSSVINNLNKRLFTTRSSNESSTRTDDQEKSYASLLSELKVLESKRWPQDKSVGFGEEEIEKLCARFKLNLNPIKNSFRDYLENTTDIPKDLTPLLNCSKLIPCSSSVCGRGFSHMNIIISPTRTRLTIEHVAALMFIKLNGPNIRTWNPDQYVRTWLRQHHRSADDTRIRQEKHKPTTEKIAFADYL